MSLVFEDIVTTVFYLVWVLLGLLLKAYFTALVGVFGLLIDVAMLYWLVKLREAEERRVVRPFTDMGN
jgi:hypothetical protein